MLQVRHVNPIPQEMTTAKSQARMEQSCKGKQANLSKQQATQGSVVQCRQDCLLNDLKTSKMKEVFFALWTIFKTYTNNTNIEKSQDQLRRI